MEERDYKIALQRIKKCIDEKSSELDLSDLELTKIPKEIKQCTQLKVLDLSSNQISRIENLEELILLDTLNLGNRSLKDKIADEFPNYRLRNSILRIEGLESLILLQQLDLSENQISKIEGLEKLTRLQQLDLSENQISKIEGLEKLVQLQQLDLALNKIGKIEGLQKLVQLQELVLWENQICKIEGLEKLVQLQRLELWENQISKIEGLEKLVQLRQLHLDSNQINKIEGLERLVLLRQLVLTENQIRKIEGLEKLVQLQELTLSHNQISKVEGLENLLQLQQLYLAANSISTIEGLEKLVQLEELYLSNNQINEIEGLEKLVQLQELYLWRNQIRKIQGLEKLVQLQRLELWQNQIGTIEGLEKLVQLQQLDLSENQIRTVEELHKLLHFIKQFKALQLLNLEENPLNGIPEEIINGHEVEGSFRKTCVDELMSWFADLEKGRETNYQVKLMLIGNGASGKTSLVGALKKGICEIEPSSTHGVLIDVLDLYMDEPLQFFSWDFGGQEIYLGTHRLFLSSKGIQLIVFDPESEKRSFTEDRITGEPHRNLKVDYWLRFAKEISPKSKIIIVQNKMDAHPESIKQVKLNAMNNGIPFIHVSSTQGNNIDDLRFRLRKVVNELSEYKMQMPKSWYQVREYFLKNITKAHPVRTISLMHFEERCHKVGVIEKSIPSLLRYLHDTGIIYYNQKHLKDTIIADQRWALNVIYKVLDRESQFYDFMRNETKGKCRLKYLFAEMGNEYSIEQKELILEFMRGCGLCFIVSEGEVQKITGELWCVFPEFLSEEISPAAKDYWENKKGYLLYLRKEHPFLHYYTVQQFISLLSEKTDLSLIWKSGIIVNASNGTFKVEGDFEKNIIFLSIDKSASPEWIKEIIFNIEGRYEKNLSGWQIGNDGKEYSEIIWEQFARDEKRMGSGNDDAVKKDLLESLPNVKQTKPKEIIFSYAKEDLETLQLIRKHLGGPMHDNLVTVWYDKDLSNTRDWDGEIKFHFESCDAVIIIGSSDYVSPDKYYIWHQEIPIIINRFSNQELFVIRINASAFNAPQRISTINCYEKEKSIPTSKTKQNDFVMRFVRDEILKKLLKKS